MKRATRRRLRDGVLYAVLLAVVVVVAFSLDWEAVKTNFFDADTWKAMWPDIVTIAMVNTVKYTVIAFAGGMAFALVLALLKLSPLGPYRWLATIYIEDVRAVAKPVLRHRIVRNFKAEADGISVDGIIEKLL